MKKLLHILLITAFVLLAASPAIYRIRDIKADVTGGLTLRQELDARYLKTVTDTTFVKIDSAVTAYSYFYTKSQIDARKPKSTMFEALKLLGFNAKALPIGVESSVNMFPSNAALTDGMVYWVLFQAKTDTVITGVSWLQQTQGVYTADAYSGFGLHSLSGGTLTKITQTVDDASLFKVAAFAVGSKAFPSPQTLTPGIYAISGVWNASATSTAPVIYNFGAMSANVSTLLANSVKITASLAIQTSIPSPQLMSGLTANSAIQGFWVY